MPLILLQRSLRNIGRKKFRAILIILFLSFLIGIFVLMAQVSHTASQKYTELETRVQNTIEVRPEGSVGSGGENRSFFPFETTLAQLTRIPHIVNIERYLLKRTSADGSVELIICVEPTAALRAFGELEPVDEALIIGRRFQEADAHRAVAVVGKALAEQRGISAPGTATISLNQQEFTVIGVFTSGNAFTNRQAFIPFETMKALFAPPGISKFFVTVDHIQSVRPVAHAIKTVLGSADVVTNEAIIELASSSLHTIGSTALYSSLFFFVVSALLITFLMMLVFRERLREVAIFKALGASDGEIAQQFVLESLLLTLLGEIGGLAITAAGLYFFRLTWTNIQFQLVSSSLSFSLVLQMLFTSMVLGACGSVYPVVRAIHLSPVETLRME